MTHPLAITPLTDLTTWLRGRGLGIVLLVLGAVLLARFVTWCGRRITEHMDEVSTDEDVLVRSEAAKHRAAVAQVLTWIAMALIWSVAGVLILQRLGVPVSSLVASAAVIGAALGFGAQQVVRDLLAGLFIVVERQYGYGDLVHISAVGFEGATGTIEEVALRTTRLRTLTGDVVTVANGQIVGVTNLSRDQQQWRLGGHPAVLSRPGAGDAVLGRSSPAAGQLGLAARRRMNRPMSTTKRSWVPSPTRSRSSSASTRNTSRRPSRSARVARKLTRIPTGVGAR